MSKDLARLLSLSYIATRVVYALLLFELFRSSGSYYQHSKLLS